MTAEIGRVLGGRYRLVAPIGMGASAQVYLADDVKLRRRVAVKMLHDALAGDAEFLRRFRAEARAAAALSHPNVMAVYDWSDGAAEGEVAFIVTEYLPGGSLRALLDSGALLTPSQALGVGLEAARALDYAHRRGFVHRDIKPANLLFGEDQRLRIADFGLARALAEAAWTEPQGAVLGTARYASPEQAKGETLSGKADVYSLALAMIESVTGEVPFVADTTLGTLMARVDRPLIVPDELGALQPILADAGAADPERRIDARTLAKGLLRAASELPRPAMLPLAGALAAGVLAGTDLDPTVHAPSPLDTEAAPASDLTADDLGLDPPSWVNQADPVVALAGVGALGGASWASGDAPTTAEPEGRGGDREDPHEGDDADDADDQIVDLTAHEAQAEADRDATVITEAPVATDHPTGEVALVGALVGADGVDGTDADGVDEGDGAPRRRRRWPWVVLVIIALLGIGGAAAAVVANQDDTPAQPPVVLPVPNLVGRTEAQAQAVARAAGWTTSSVHIRQDGTTRGEVLKTAPVAGTRLPSGRTIALTVSAGQTMVAVPTDLAGRSLDDATTAVEAVGLKASTANTPYSEDVAKGDVIKVADGTPAKLEKGSTVPLIVSNGPEPRTVPSGLVGSTQAAATEALQALELKVGVVSSYSDQAPKGQVISVLPKSGSTVPRDSTVTIEVSKGPQPVAVPSIKGASSIKEASAILRAQGLKPGNVSGPADGTPKRTSPKAGTLVPPGSTVDIVLG